MENKEIEIFYPSNQTVWRMWLEKNHISKQAVWLVFHTKKSKFKSISWSEAVDVALCFGWIDSKKVKIDETTSHQYFCQRKPKSTWSKINKVKVDKLTELGLMAEAGLKCIETAKQNGSWTILDEVEELIIPTDLYDALLINQKCIDFYLSLSNSIKKRLLTWLVLAKTPQTRQNRLNEIIESSEQNQIPKQFR